MVQPPALSVITGVDAGQRWLGLRSCTEELQSYLFGRDSESDEVFRRVGRKRLTVLFGQSGLGKTSLLRAGLFPRLRSAGYLPVRYILTTTRPQNPWPGKRYTRSSLPLNRPN